MARENRAARATKIIAQPHHYKVCEGCDSIVVRGAVHCPSCHGYRFDESPARVAEQARLLGGRERTSVLDSDLD